MKIPLTRSELCLDISLNCGQSFRWRKKPSGEWVGVFRGLLWILTQNETDISYQIVDPSSDDNIKKEEKNQYEDILKDYFQTDVNLVKLYSEWSKADENFCKIAKDYQGVRMLRQDPVENLFSFICSSNNNIQRISGMIEKLCDTYGTHLLRHEEVSHYNFPTIEALADREVEAKLRVLGFGYRAKFIQQSAAKIVENGGREWLLNLRTLPYNEAKTALMTLPGIGAKVADCICLMSLNHACAIPVDTHVFQIAKSTYMPHLKVTKSVTDRGYNEISTFFQNLYGPYAGWAHSVLFSADLRHLKVQVDNKRSSSQSSQDEKPSRAKQKKTRVKSQ